VDRATWTDERLDDLSNRMDAGFERVDRDIRDLRSEMRTEIGGLRVEMRDAIGGLRGELGGEIEALRSTILHTGGGIMIGLVGVIAAVFASGG
jgi:hypothetical protein